MLDDPIVLDRAGGVNHNRSTMLNLLKYITPDDCDVCDRKDTFRFRLRRLRWECSGCDFYITLGEHLAGEYTEAMQDRVRDLLIEIDSIDKALVDSLGPLRPPRPFPTPLPWPPSVWDQFSDLGQSPFEPYVHQGPGAGMNTQQVTSENILREMNSAMLLSNSRPRPILNQGLSPLAGALGQGLGSLAAGLGPLSPVSSIAAVPPQSCPTSARQTSPAPP